MTMFDTPTRSELMAEFDEAEELRAERRAIDADPGPEEPRSCTRCDGGGEVYWNPSHIGDPQLEQSAPCPRCDGSATEPGTGAST